MALNSINGSIDRVCINQRKHFTLSTGMCIWMIQRLSELIGFAPYKSGEINTSAVTAAEAPSAMMGLHEIKTQSARSLLCHKDQCTGFIKESSIVTRIRSILM